MTDRNPTPTPSSRNKTTELYRFYAADGPPNYGRLLYVGISRSALARMKAHHKDSDWMVGATRMTIKRFHAEEAAALAEIEAIRTEHPAFNITHAVDQDTRIRHLLAHQAALEDEIRRLRAELDAARFANNIVAGTNNYRLSVKGVARLIRLGKRDSMHCDGNNLYLKTNGNGHGSWVFRYSRAGKFKTVGLGPVHAVSLRDARVRAYKMRQLLQAGLDPRDDPWFSHRRRNNPMGGTRDS